MLYHINQSLLALRANLTASLATLLTMTLTLTMLALVTLTSLNLQRVVASFENQVEIAAFLKPAVPGENPRARDERVERVLQIMPGIASTQFVTKEQALADLTLDYTYLAGANRVLSNPLPDTIRVKPTSARFVASIAAALRSLPDVDSVEAGEEFAAKAATAFDVARTGGNALVILLVLNTLFNILNTIRVAMYARREEINVMRLIGATRGFIRAPYLLEGVGMALIASVITAVVVYPAYSTGARALQAALPFLPITLDPLVTIKVIAIVGALGLVIGFFGSLVAANRYLREVE